MKVAINILSVNDGVGARSKLVMVEKFIASLGTVRVTSIIPRHGS